MPQNDTVEKTADEDIVKLAKDCLEKYQDRESDNIKRAEDAIRFRAGEQWPDAIRIDREDDNQEGGARPCPVMDKTDQYVRQIVNEERMNRAAIKIRPVDDGADPETAEMITGLIRHIEDASEALVAYTTAGEHAVDGGFGYFRILADFADPMAFNQEIRIKRIHNRFSVAPGYHTESDAADMKECLVWEDMRLSDFKSEYPKAKEVNFEDNGDWADKDMIRVAEYFCIKPEPTTIHLFDDGRVLTDKNYKEAKEAAEKEDIVVPDPVDSRETQVNRVKWYKVTAEEVLESEDLPGTYIPVVKVTGNEITMPDGKIRLSGAIEAAMDSQRLHNYSIAGYIEHVALAPRAPWLAEESQIEGYENDFADANRKPIALLKYKATANETGQPIPPPQRTPPAGMSSGWQAMLQNTEHGIEASFGMYGASVGATGQEKSGVALQEQKAQGAIGQFQFPDNLARAIQHCGRILVEWLPVYYDTATTARILGEDGEQEQVRLDPSQKTSVMDSVDLMGNPDGKIYNLSVGKYDVTVATGASYTSKRQEAVETQTQIVQAAPELMQVIGDILFDNMDAPGSDKIAERLKTLLPPEIKQLEENKQKNIDPQTQEAMQQVEQAAKMLEEKGQAIMELEREVEVKAQEATADKNEVDSAIKDLNSQKKVFMADAKTMKANLELMGMQLINQIEDVTEPLMSELSKQTQEVETGEVDEEGKPEVIVVNDPAMQEILQNIVAMTQTSTAQMAETVNNALMTVSESISAPKETTLQYDEMGNPIGSVTQ
jgi:hypothetical protein